MNKENKNGITKDTHNKVSQKDIDVNSALCRQITNIPSTPQKIRSYSPKQRVRSNFSLSR